MFAKLQETFRAYTLYKICFPYIIILSFLKCECTCISKVKRQTDDHIQTTHSRSVECPGLVYCFIFGILCCFQLSKEIRNYLSSTKNDETTASVLKTTFQCMSS